MQHLNYTDRDFVAHTAEVMNDLVCSRNGYTDADAEACRKLEAVGKGGTALVVTGAELDGQAARELMGRVIQAELDHWVTESSRRLIWRAGKALGFEMPAVLIRPFNEIECGSQRIYHSLAPLSIGGRHLMCCSTCGRLYA